MTWNNSQSRPCFQKKFENHCFPKVHQYEESTFAFKESIEYLQRCLQNMIELLGKFFWFIGLNLLLLMLNILQNNCMYILPSTSNGGMCCVNVLHYTKNHLSFFRMFHKDDLSKKYTGMWYFRYYRERLNFSSPENILFRQKMKEDIPKEALKILVFWLAKMMFLFSCISMALNLDRIDFS